MTCAYCFGRPGTQPDPRPEKAGKRVCKPCAIWLVDALAKLERDEARLDKRDRDRERIR